MKAPNMIWSGLFLAVVMAAERMFGTDTVATQGAALATAVSWVLKMWQEYQAGKYAVPMTGIRAVMAPQPGFWRRVLTR